MEEYSHYGHILLERNYISYVGPSSDLIVSIESGESLPSVDDQDQSDMASYMSANQELLNLIGIRPGRKGEGIFRLMYENLNGLPARISGNPKLTKKMSNIDELEVDLFGFNEHKINCLHKDNKRVSLGQMFDGGVVLSRAIGGNFKHPIAQTMGK